MTDNSGNDRRRDIDGRIDTLGTRRNGVRGRIDPSREAAGTEGQSTAAGEDAAMEAAVGEEESEMDDADAEAEAEEEDADTEAEAEEEDADTEAEAEEEDADAEAEAEEEDTDTETDADEADDVEGAEEDADEEPDADIDSEDEADDEAADAEDEADADDEPAAAEAEDSEDALHAEDDEAGDADEDGTEAAAGDAEGEASYENRPANVDEHSTLPVELDPFVRAYAARRAVEHDEETLDEYVVGAVKGYLAGLLGGEFSSPGTLERELEIDAGPILGGLLETVGDDDAVSDVVIDAIAEEYDVQVDEETLAIAGLRDHEALLNGVVANSSNELDDVSEVVQAAVETRLIEEPAE